MSLPSASLQGPVFVVGVFRSGTSLLYSLLNQHPDVALMYECDVWDFPGAFCKWRFKGAWLERQEFFNQVLSRHRLILDGRLHGLEHIETPDDLYQCHGKQKGAIVWGEKSPVYTVRLSSLARRYPRGRFILLWRDPVEVYRSMRKAGKNSSFFGRPGMLLRLIDHQERMVAGAAQLENAGVRVLHIHYDRLVDQTTAVCHEVCEFLHLRFDPRMAGLKGADFSAIYDGRQHDYLRRGVIERQSSGGELMGPASVRKLTRFRTRWERLGRRPLSLQPISRPAGEPGFVELGFHRAAGRWLHLLDGVKRLGFEFLPLPWLRTYRLFKDWLFARGSGLEKNSLRAEFHQHRVTVLASFFALALVAIFDYATGPEFSCGPFYAIPCALLALVAGPGWATVAALVAAVSATMLQAGVAPNSQNWFSAAAVWNLAMSFIFFEFFVLLLDRIRRQFARQGAAGNSARRP